MRGRRSAPAHHHRCDVVACELAPEERDETYPKVVALRSEFGEYQKRTTRVIPLFELQRV